MNDFRRYIHAQPQTGAIVSKSASKMVLLVLFLTVPFIAAPISWDGASADAQHNKAIISSYEKDNTFIIKLSGGGKRYVQVVHGPLNWYVGENVDYYISQEGPHMKSTDCPAKPTSLVIAWD